MKIGMIGFKDKIYLTFGNLSSNNELEKAQTWKKIKSWNGNGIKNTESFIIKSDEWRIKWTNKGMLLQITVYHKDKRAFTLFD